MYSIDSLWFYATQTHVQHGDPPTPPTVSSVVCLVSSRLVVSARRCVGVTSQLTRPVDAPDVVATAN